MSCYKFKSCPSVASVRSCVTFIVNTGKKDKAYYYFAHLKNAFGLHKIYPRRLTSLR